MTDLKAFHDEVKRGDLAAVERSLESDASLLDAANESGQTALLLAKYYRQEALADYLLSRNPKLDLFLAAAAGRSAVVLDEVDRDPALLQTHSGDGWTPLHLAAFFGYPALAGDLLDRGTPVDVRSTNSMRNTPLHAAAAGRKLALMRLLLERGADVNARQHGGWSALHTAAQNGDREMAELLVAHGADVGVRAENQQGALDMALLKGHQELAALLEELGAKLN